ncbi:MAG: hypothetical protein J2P15_24345, partial [Micromonosporaceae bacterium]|nr:hypothetical protein [Micromonosporaceae bacterium]
AGGVATRTGRRGLGKLPDYPLVPAAWWPAGQAGPKGRGAEAAFERAAAMTRNAGKRRLFQARAKQLPGG